MKTFELLSEAAPSLEELLKLAEQESLLLKTADGREYMSEVDGLSQEIERIRNNPELMEFLAHRSQEKERLSLEQVKQKLGL